jgi:hypothetical protein
MRHLSLLKHQESVDKEKAPASKCKVHIYGHTKHINQFAVWQKKTISGEEVP